MPAAIRTARQLAVACARIASDKKAVGIVILDVGAALYLTDFFVIATGTNPRQLKAIADETTRALKKAGVRRLGEEGRPEAGWVLMDFGDVVLHLFDEERRRFYDLEGIWADAARVPWGRRRAKERPEGEVEGPGAGA